MQRRNILIIIIRTLRTYSFRVAQKQRTIVSNIFKRNVIRQSHGGIFVWFANKISRSIIAVFERLGLDKMCKFRHQMHQKPQASRTSLIMTICRSLYNGNLHLIMAVDQFLDT